MVDGLEVAQFLYTLIRNSGWRRVIDALSSRTVLLLGRFNGGGLLRLQLLRDHFTRLNLTPIIFDFENPKSRNESETVQILARIAKFVVADVTEPRSVPYELAMIVPTIPSIPVIPIVDGRIDVPFSMIKNLQRYAWFGEVMEYSGLSALTDEFAAKLLRCADLIRGQLANR